MKILVPAPRTKWRGNVAAVQVDEISWERRSDAGKFWMTELINRSSAPEKRKEEAEEQILVSDARWKTTAESGKNPNNLGRQASQKDLCQG